MTMDNDRASSHSPGLPLVEASPEKQSRKTPEDQEAVTSKTGPSLPFTLLANKEEINSIHTRVLRSIVEQPRQRTAQNNQLNALKRRRVALAAQVEEYRERVRNVFTVGDELRQRQRRALDAQRRPYLRRLDDSAASKSEQCQEETTSIRSSSDPVNLIHHVLEERAMAERMHRIRLRRKIAAAYRLAGISFLSCGAADEEILALRLDVSVEGHFVACYHAFFDLVTADPYMGSGKERSFNQKPSVFDASVHGCDDLYLRVVQHTLPACVPLASILQETLGGAVRLGPVNDDSRWETKRLMPRLRSFANQLYCACYCFASRKHTVKILESLSKKHEAASDGRIYVTGEIQPSDSCERISFHITLLSGSCTLSVQLHYKDPMRALPSVVTVKNLTATGVARVPRSRTALAMSISDDDREEDAQVQDDLVETATIAFRRSTLDKALRDVAEAMSEW